MKFDLHVHTKLSYDSKMTTDKLVAAAREAGLSGVAIADHNAFAEHKKRDNFFIVPSCEFSTDVGHLVVYFLKKPINENLSRDEYGRFYWRDICKEAHNQGALVFYAHPFSPQRSHPDSLYEQLDGIEVFNSRVVHSRIRNANDRALELCREKNLAFSAGSDAHCPAEVGTSFLELDIPESAINEPDFEETLKAAILGKQGRVFAGAASPYDVLKCKIFMYKSERLYSKLIKAYIKYALTFLSSFSAKGQEGKYMDVYMEE